MSFTYYLTVAVTCLAIAIFNISTESSGKTLVCYSLTTMSEDDYSKFKSTATTTGSSDVVMTTVNGINTYTVPTDSSNMYSIFSFIIAIGYFVIMGISFLLTIVLYWLSDLVPDDFIAMGRIKRFTAVTTKIFPPFIVLLHWIVMVLIIIFWIMLVMGTCEYSKQATPTFDFNNFRYHNQCVTLQIVNSIVFFLLHYVGAILKDMIYVEPFMYSPQVGESSMFKEVVFRILGP